MKIVCYVDSERTRKTTLVMRAFALGCSGVVVPSGVPAVGATDHVIMGSWRDAQRLIPRLQKRGQPFWHVDNGWIARTPEGRRCYRVTRNGIAPQFLPGRSMERAVSLGVKIEPWRTDGRHVLVCLPGELFGRPFGISSAEWSAGIIARIKAVTDRPIVVRAKIKHGPPLSGDLAGAWCLVTHSSSTAAAAALAGVSVFCEPTCGAAQVGCEDLAMIETPLRPDREEWIASLVWQQFTLNEMSSGMAWRTINGHD